MLDLRLDSCYLNRIDEELLLAVEHRDADEEQDEGEKCAVTEGGPGELTSTVRTVFEGLDNRRHGVEKHDLMQGRIRHITERINDWCSVHPERHKHTEKVRQIAVFRCQRRDNKSKPQCQALNQ